MLGSLLLALATAPPPEEPVLTTRTTLRGEEAADPTEVGEPFDLICRVEHDAGTHPRLEPVELDPLEPWVVFDSRRGPTGVDAGLPPGAPDASGAREVTELTWTLACLEPGPVELPWLSFTLEVDGRARTFLVQGDPVGVRGVLGEAEDEPRPIRGFRDLPAEEESLPALLLWIPALLLGLFLLVAVLAVPLLRRALRRGPPRAPAALARLDALAQAPLPPRARHFELTRLLREELDGVSGRDRRGLTDDEWLAALAEEERLPEAAKSAASAALRRARDVKYAGGTPTDWALEEALAEARRALEGVHRPGQSAGVRSDAGRPAAEVGA